MRQNRIFFAYTLAVCGWLLAVFLALKLGTVPQADLEIISQIRLPRVILASTLGMGLAVAGATLQALFSNPLCEPYNLGISSGSALGAVIGATLGYQGMFEGFAGTAFLGALSFAAILYLISLRTSESSTHLLLAGVMLGFMGTSLVALWITLSDTNGLSGILLWLFGDLSRARLKGALFGAGSVLGVSLILWSRWRELDALLVGEEGAAALGIDVAATRRKIILLVSMLIAVCVSAGGMIGFVGLVVPHFARRFVGALHLRLLPLCAIWGATALTLSDCLSRVVAQPYELPVGVVTALMGSPVFLWVMLTHSQFSKLD